MSNFITSLIGFFGFVLIMALALFVESLSNLPVRYRQKLNSFITSSRFELLSRILAVQFWLYRYSLSLSQTRHRNKAKVDNSKITFRSSREVINHFPDLRDR